LLKVSSRTMIFFLAVLVLTVFESKLRSASPLAS
jgi:hypothetical protein